MIELTITLILLAIVFLVTAERSLRKRVIKLEQAADMPRLGAFRTKLTRLDYAFFEDLKRRIEELEAKRWPVAKPVDGKDGKT